MLDIFCD